MRPKPDAGRLHAADIKASVQRLSDLGKSEVEQWRLWRSANSALSSPFLSPEFALAFGRHNEKARVVVFESGNDVVGFLPFEQHPRHVAKALASGLADVQAAITAPGTEIPLAAAVRSAGIHVFEFDHFVTSQTPLLKTGARLEPSPVIDLSRGYEHWLEEKKKSSKRRFKRIFQLQRQTERELGPIQFTFESRDADDVLQLMRWKSDQYVRTGRRDRFANRWFADFVHDLFDSSNEQLTFVLSRFAADGRVLALELALRSGTTLAGWFPAYDRSVSVYSPGTMCFINQVECASDAGITRIDLGPGEADYKRVFKTHDDEVASGRITANTAYSYLRMARTTPVEATHRFVLRHPELRKTARNLLNVVGSVRGGFRKGISGTAI